MKKFISFALMLLLLTVNAMAANDVNIVVDKKPVEAKGTIIENTTMVPVRGVFEQMGYTVDYDNETKTATLKHGSNTVTVKAGEKTFSFDNLKFTPAVPQQIIDGHFMLPLRSVCEAVCADVKWDAETKTANITTLQSHFSIAQVSLDDVDEDNITDINAN